MVKVIIFYDSKYGNTKLVAEKIAEGLKSGGIDSDLGYVKEVKVDGNVCVDALVLGAPNHMGRPSCTMKSFIGRLAKGGCKAKNVAVFGTYSGKQRQQDRAEKKLEKMVTDKLSISKLIVPGISVRVNGMSGPVFEGELPKCVEFGRAIAAQLQKNLQS